MGGRKLGLLRHVSFVRLKKMHRLTFKLIRSDRPSIFPKRAIFAFLFFIVPSLLATFLGLEVWPFSNFPMYSKASVQSGEYVDYQLWALPVDNEPYELKNGLFPYTKSFFTKIIDSIFKEHPDQLDQLTEYYLGKLSLKKVKCVQIRRLSGERETDFKITVFENIIISEKCLNGSFS